MSEQTYPLASLSAHGCTNSLRGCSSVGHGYVGVLCVDSAVPFRVLLTFSIPFHSVPFRVLLTTVFHVVYMYPHLAAVFHVHVSKPCSSLSRIQTLFLSRIIQTLQQPFTSYPNFAAVFHVSSKPCSSLSLRIQTLQQSFAYPNLTAVFHVSKPCRHAATPFFIQVRQITDLSQAVLHKEHAAQNFTHVLYKQVQTQ